MNLDPQLHKIALIGNHLPRRCGIATFTSDLADALTVALPRADLFVVAMNEPGHRHAYPERVTIEIAQDDLSAYRRAARAINESGADCVSLQHEYGIFGGASGSHVLALVRELRMPVVTTLHTLMAAPSASERTVMDELTSLSSRLVVMSMQGASLLRGVHGVHPSKIDFIPHGIPSAPLPTGTKHQLGLEGRSVLLTFGLLSPGKGIEHVIDALPAIRERNPDVAYVVLGATHPHVRAKDGERYRDSLVARAKSLDVEGCVVFHDRFVSSAELASYLGAADVYVTPYLQPEQITSGTLAYALGAGKPVVATPYRYARELLADGRGIVVPWGKPDALARELGRLLADAPRRAILSARGRAYGETMKWPVVGGRYAEAFARARAEDVTHLRALGETQAVPTLRLDHLEMLTDSAGILQHASYAVPRYDDGYCTDDNARALLLTTWLDADEVPGTPSRARVLQSRYLAFVTHAFRADTGRFRNFMSFARHFHEDVGSEDCHGRALWALGAVVGRAGQPSLRRHARDLFLAALPATSSFSSPRAWAYALLGLDAYLETMDVDRVADEARRALAGRLLGLYERTSAPSWPWFEDRLSYANARMPQALIATGRALGDEDMMAAGLRALDWLSELQTGDDVLAPLGADAVYVRGGERPRFDQQPIEACGMVSACLEAHRVTREARWSTRARRAFGWFLGDNELHQSLYDASTGGCRDGLHVDRVNENQGAESTLSFLTSLVELRAAERTERPVPRTSPWVPRAHPAIRAQQVVS
jgi:glycosyltransferase involved in cell wall biosynthesis